MRSPLPPSSPSPPPTSAPLASPAASPPTCTTSPASSLQESSPSLPLPRWTRPRCSPSSPG
uniref:DNA-3-methyladenine glycosylase 1 n=1 Tax=Arundo donax TaxID=35708 RepID=A0A0A9D3U8_ARUDO